VETTVKPDGSSGQEKMQETLFFHGLEYFMAAEALSDRAGVATAEGLVFSGASTYASDPEDETTQPAS
jgi:hypothetical protein